MFASECRQHFDLKFPIQQWKKSALFGQSKALVIREIRRPMIFELLETRVPLASDLLIDLSQNAESIRSLTSSGGDTFFVASTRETGEELWKLDVRSPVGATLVTDLCPGPCGAQVSYLTVVGSSLFFSARTDVDSYSLWKSDGTVSGTIPLVSGTAFNLTNVGGTLFFSLDNQLHGKELWKSDGTAAGTSMVLDIRPGQYGGAPFYLTNVSGTLFFVARDDAHSNELWKSDGTASGTLMVKDIKSSGSSGPKHLTNVNGTLFFDADDGTYGRELWKSDGTSPGTVMVVDNQKGLLSSDPQELINVGGMLYFTAPSGSPSSNRGRELMKSDGTAAGTVLVKDIKRGRYGSSPTELTNVVGTLFFRAADLYSGIELWKSDGTTDGTAQVADLFPGSSSSNLQGLTNVGGTLFFTANDGTRGQELWRTDGVTAAPLDLRDGILSSFPSSLENINGSLVFAATTDAGLQLWKSATAGAPLRVTNQLFASSEPSDSQEFTRIGSRTFFIASTPTFGRELWTLDDGSTTPQVFDIWPGASGSYPIGLTILNGTLYFSAVDGSNTRNLWRSDGSTGVPAKVSDLVVGTTLTEVGGTLFFSANDYITNGWELWKSDGTATGTSLVKDISKYSSDPSMFTNVGGVVFFRADDFDHRAELWKSDGTTAGTVLVADIRPGSKDSFIASLTNVGGTLFFGADDGVHGQELWKSDGTASGTVLVADISPGASGSIPSNLVNIGGTLYFTANDGTHGYELWKANATTGAALVKDLWAGNTNSNLGNLTNVLGKLYFSADDGIHGNELWSTDGTATGTVQLGEILPGRSGSYPGNLVGVADVLYFSANDGTHGHELWKREGSVNALVKDIQIGRFASYPKHLANIAGKLYFGADDGNTGNEVWITTARDQPIAQPDKVRALKNQPVEIDVRQNDMNPNGTTTELTVVLAQAPPTTAGTTVILSDGRVRFTPAFGFTGVTQFSYRIRDRFGGESANVSVVVGVASSAMQNPFEPIDANRDGYISPIDALLIINLLNNANLSRQVDQLKSLNLGDLDVNGDNYVSPFDALLLINRLNTDAGSGEGDADGLPARFRSPTEQVDFLFQDLEESWNPLKKSYYEIDYHFELAPKPIGLRSLASAKQFPNRPVLK